MLQAASTGRLRPSDLNWDRSALERARSESRAEAQKAGAEINAIVSNRRQRHEELDDKLSGLAFLGLPVLGAAIGAGIAIKQPGTGAKFFGAAGWGALIGAGVGAPLGVLFASGDPGGLKLSELRRVEQLRDVQREHLQTASDADQALGLLDGGALMTKINESGAGILEYDHDGDGAIDLRPGQPLGRDERLRDPDGGPVRDERLVTKLRKDAADFDRNGDGLLARHEFELQLAEQYLPEWYRPTAGGSAPS